ncbi:hypothetical protein NC653_011607 [Populus alba x Populus x berolinensis]|uniref:Major facilitator superfamily (MFS) profile domain-containing protein n=1 Tax=Populus alba x Populus x berolinensis TaxID=444605 RepID=A0AAD6W830_9ROSI|nr:hypothetical protein NC653_011607 [Populus alba x Populus x berolinensis]
MELFLQMLVMLQLMDMAYRSCLQVLNSERDVNPSQPTTEKTLADFDPVKKPKRNKFAFACAILASWLQSYLVMRTLILPSFLHYPNNFYILVIDIGVMRLLVGTLNWYSLVGSAAAGVTSDWIGRRYTIVVAGAIFFAGALLMGFSTNYAFLMVARFVAGIGVGFALMIAPVFINVGILLGYVSNYAFSKLPTNLGWRIMLGVGAIPSVFLALVVIGMPSLLVG